MATPAAAPPALAARTHGEIAFEHPGRYACYARTTWTNQQARSSR
jgi:hypothetical protein